LAPDLAEAIARGDGAAFVDAVDAMLARHDDDGARKALWRGMERWPEDVRLARRLADALHRAGDDEGMRRFGALVHRRRLASSDLHYALGVWAEAQGLAAAAARAFARAARADPDDADAIVRLARVLRTEQRPDLAQRVVERALARQPEAAELHAALGYASIDAHRPVAAAKCFREAVRLAPDWLTYREDLAGALLLCESWREAAEVAQAVVRETPRSERGWAALASAFARLGRRDQADRAYRRAIDLSARPARLHGNYGLFLAADPGRLFEAARHLNVALEAFPDWDEVRASLAELAG
jgi:Tfp pilus assembly protein PilF